MLIIINYIDSVGMTLLNITILVFNFVIFSISGFDSGLGSLPQPWVNRSCFLLNIVHIYMYSARQVYVMEVWVAERWQMNLDMEIWSMLKEWIYKCTEHHEVSKRIAECTLTDWHYEIYYNVFNDIFLNKVSLLFFHGWQWIC